MYVNAAKYNFKNFNTVTVLQFLCEIDRTIDLTLDKLNILLEPAFKISSEKNEVDNLEIRKA